MTSKGCCKVRLVGILTKGLGAMIYSANDRKTKTLHTKKAKNEKTIVNSHQTKKEGKKGKQTVPSFTVKQNPLRAEQ